MSIEVGEEKPRDRTVDAVFVEFEALRAETISKAGARLGLVGVYVTTVSVVAGLVLSGGVNVRVLLVIPILSSGFALAILGEGRDMAIVGSYVRDVLQPIVVEQTGDERLFGYEQYYRTRSSEPFLPKAIAMGLLFPGVAATALIVSVSTLTSVGEWAVWWVGAAMLLSTFNVARARVRRFLRSTLRRG
jgi:hypothetical protein